LPQLFAFVYARRRAAGCVTQVVDHFNLPTVVRYRTVLLAVAYGEFEKCAFYLFVRRAFPDQTSFGWPWGLTAETSPPMNIKIILEVVFIESHQRSRMKNHVGGQGSAYCFFLLVSLVDIIL
jgi:hypothetical protein